jgi:hypothetical protein
MLGRTYRKIIANAGYESGENYAYLEENKQDEYIKPTNYEGMKRGNKKDISQRENMAYEGIRDEYTRGNGKRLRAVRTETRMSKGGYEREITVYACEECSGCPVRERCRASKKNRETGVSKKLLACREASRVNITREEGNLR